MTPQEFRQLYLNSQDQLGNNLQTLTTLASEFGSVIEQINQNYETINIALDAFLNQLEAQPGEE
ncbi:MAG: hypothetical protein SFY66_07920 [Oculatellaceae cyanobacterium bins.114]|nr:hypothetical protein [Oculatellaceae cyanobacterium bins.114]